MNVAHLRGWDLTAIEIALDLEVPPLSDPASFDFAGRAEPRICLIAAFALTSQLKRIVAAIDRSLPPRLPHTLRVAPPRTRGSGGGAAAGAISIRPMPALIRIQSRLIRAITPGLAGTDARARDMDERTSRYIGEFISSGALPTFEPPHISVDVAPIDLVVLGITIYRLDGSGKPQSMLGHWTYAPSTRQSIPLRSGP